MVNVSTDSVLGFLTGACGLVLAVLITGGVIWFVRAPLSKMLQRFIADKAVADAASLFVLILLGLHGLQAALGYITQSNLSVLFRGLTGLLLSMAGVMQWIIQIAALLFIAYSIQAKHGAAGKEE